MPGKRPILLTDERRREIVKLLKSDGRVSVGDLVRRFGVSAVTLRADLEQLSQKGILVRSYGGAMLPQEPHEDFPLNIKKTIYHAEKTRIGKAAARLVLPHQKVILDSGTTTVEVARALKRSNFESLTVITHALNVAEEFVDASNISVIMIGGVMRHVSGSFVGPQAERFLSEWKERLQKFGLELHPDKTRLIEFGREAAENRKQRGEDKPETFDFLGFTHMCGTTRKTGRFIVKRKTIRKRLSGKLGELKEELRRRWHQPIAEVGKWLKSVVQGYFNYHAVPGNLTSLGVFRDRVLALWWRTIRRRSHKHRNSWTRILVLAQRWLPQPRALHPFPDARFAASHPR